MERFQARLKAFGLNVTWLPFDGDHAIPDEVVDGMNAFIGRSFNAIRLSECGSATISDREKLMSFNSRSDRRAWPQAVAVVVVAASLQAQQARKVDDAMLLKPPDGEWISYGRDQAETHHSPLKQIDQSNVGATGRGVVDRSRLRRQDRNDAAGVRRRALRHHDVEPAYAIDLRTGKVKWTVGPGPGARRLRSRWSTGVLRSGESRRRALQRPGLRRPARRPARRA